MLALFLVRRGLALGAGLLGVAQFFTCRGQRDARFPLTADGQSFLPAIETTIVTEGDGTDGRYRLAHAISVGILASQ